MDSHKIAMSILLEDPLGKKDRKVVPSWDIRTAKLFSNPSLFKTALQDSSQFLDPIEFKALMQDLQQRLDFPKDEILLFLAEVQGVFFRGET